MNYPNAGQPPPQMAPPTQKRFPMAAVVLGIFGLLVVLAVVGGIKVFHAVQGGSSEAIAVGNRFIDNMGRHHYPAADALFTPQVQAKTPADNLKDIETLVEKHHGTYVNHGKPQWNIQSWNSQTRVYLAYPTQFTKSSSTVSLTLVQTDKGYQVYDAHYEF
jgi:hypothetical protein